MYKSRKGISILGFLFLATLLGMYLVLALKLIPSYYEHRLIKRVTKRVVSKEQNHALSKAEMYKLIEQKVYVDGVKLPNKDRFKLVREKGVALFIIDYTKEVPVMANISALLHFHDEFRL